MLQKVRPVGKLSGEQDDELVFQPKKEKAKMDKKGFLSKSVVHVQRRKATGFLLHDDTKLVKPKGKDREDRSAVLINRGIHNQPYLVGIPRFWSSSDKDVEAGIFRELGKYNISLGKCFVTCYEATFNNYGLKNGAHFIIEKNLSFRFNAASNCMARNPM